MLLVTYGTNRWLTDRTNCNSDSGMEYNIKVDLKQGGRVSDDFIQQQDNGKYNGDLKRVMRFWTPHRSVSFVTG